MSGMIERIKGILTTPKAEWAKIDAEPMTTAGILTGWVLPLALIGPAATAIGLLAFGYSAFGIVVRPSVNYVVATAVIGYVMAVVGTFVLSLIIDALAPSFGGQKNSIQAFKVAAFSATASWLAGIFGIVPALSVLSLLGLYSLYLLWVGLPMLMRVPQDKAAVYLIVTIVVAIVVYIVLGAISGALVLAFAPPTLPAAAIAFPQ